MGQDVEKGAGVRMNIWETDEACVEAREAVRSALRRETHGLTAEEAANLDLGKTTLHQVKVNHRKEAYAALDAYARAVAVAVLTDLGCERQTKTGNCIEKGHHALCRVHVRLRELEGEGG